MSLRNSATASHPIHLLNPQNLYQTLYQPIHILVSLNFVPSFSHRLDVVSLRNCILIHRAHSRIPQQNRPCISHHTLVSLHNFATASSTHFYVVVAGGVEHRTRTWAGVKPIMREANRTRLPTKPEREVSTMGVLTNPGCTEYAVTSKCAARSLLCSSAVKTTLHSLDRAYCMYLQGTPAHPPD